MSESTMTIDENGTKYWRNKIAKLHRLDGPAIEWIGGGKQWYQNGKLHRLDGPAIEYSNGSKEWYQNGKLHRTDGPAVESINNIVMWYYNDVYLGDNIKGFWKLWKRLDEEGRQNVNLHTWLARLQNA